MLTNGGLKFKGKGSIKSFRSLNLEKRFKLKGLCNKEANPYSKTSCHPHHYQRRSNDLISNVHAESKFNTTS